MRRTASLIILTDWIWSCFKSIGQVNFNLGFIDQKNDVTDQEKLL